MRKTSLFFPYSISVSPFAFSFTFLASLSFLPLPSPSQHILSCLPTLIPLHYTHSFTYLLTFSILSSLHHHSSFSISLCITISLRLSFTFFTFLLRPCVSPSLTFPPKIPSEAIINLTISRI